MENAVLIILLALIQYLFFCAYTGFSRNKYNVQPPKCTGNDTWERIFRVQQNTLEQLIIFIPSVITFSYYVSSTWVYLPGIFFILARFYYFKLYVNDPATRGPGFVVTFLSNIVLVLGSLIALIQLMMKS